MKEQAKGCERLDAALQYAHLGWAVFPVCWIKDGKCACGMDRASPGKHLFMKLALQVVLVPVIVNEEAQALAPVPRPGALAAG